ncbi:hypothetical protein [Marinobacter qingdaonensis]|uniref:HEPN domain-containing protein n=1 Tax=Marinobacter qingdaonensis TaxID=3108486 RepID=A0ABU5NU52_9GAMM|nr:hypothetical protein [Marinobacter sp. ASW11-75]MEA1079302.1 hypothetical protein [Marinobacter sp. ASW11-75]
MGNRHLRGLGFKAPEVFRKSEVAINQLTQAIELFLQENFICSLTLAGAADAILAGLLESEGQQPSHEVSYDLLRTFRAVLDLDPAIDQQSKGSIFKAWNSGRNKLKHHDPSDEIEFEMNDCDEAYWMIRRALRNAAALKLDVRNKVQFDTWVQGNQKL